MSVLCPPGRTGAAFFPPLPMMLSELEGAIMALSVPAACQEGEAWGKQLSGVVCDVGHHSTNHILMYFYDLLFWERQTWIKLTAFPSATSHSGQVGPQWHQPPWAVQRTEILLHKHSSLCPAHWSCFTYRAPGGWDQHPAGWFAKQILSCWKMSLSQVFAPTFTTLSTV